MRLLLTLALVGTACAQELTSQEGTIVARSIDGLRQVRQQEVNSFEVSQLVESQAGEISTLREMMSTMMGPQSPITAAVQVIAADMTDRTMGLMSTASENAVNLATVTSNLNGLTSSVDVQLAAATTAAQAAAAAQAATLAATVNSMELAASSTAAAQASTLTATVDSMTNTMDTRINAVLASLGSTAAALRTAQTSGASTLAASVDVEIRRLNVSLAAVNTGLAGKRSAASHIFVGSCSNHGNSGWRDYCMNRVHVDSARPMFRKESNTRLRSIPAGYFMMHFHRMMQTCNWAYTLLMFNGGHPIHSHNWQGGNSHWRDDKVTMTYPLAANQQFWARTWNGCWSSWHTSTSHTKFHAMYMGAIPA